MTRFTHEVADNVRIGASADSAACGHAHFTVQAAAACAARIQRRTRATHGPRTWSPIRVVAFEISHGVRHYRPLTADEAERYADAIDRETRSRVW